MADARSLLRAHRAANRIEHPFAAYSDSGKLLCKVCREAIKSEALWENHIRSLSHCQRAAAASSAAEKTTTAAPETSHNKRKHDDAEAMDVEEDSEDAMPRKRNRTTSSAAANNGAHTPERNGNSPGLTRRASTTPAHGIEISIPSRPATPLVPGEGSRTPTPNMVPMGRSPLMGPTSAPFVTSGGASQIPSISTENLPVPGQVPTSASAAGTTTAAVDESEWAAFEAEMAAEDAPAPATATSYRDATISAPALTAEELAAKSQDEENERRKQLLDAQIADEREDATRALEDEFDEMAQLESRVRRLKERRELLRKGGLANGGASAAGQQVEVIATAAAVPEKKALLSAGKENAAVHSSAGIEDDEEDDADEDDDWDDGFRFRV
jgi:zinc finger protein 830